MSCFRKISFFILFLFFEFSLNSHTNKTYLQQISDSFYLPNNYFFSTMAKKNNAGLHAHSKIDLTLFYYQSTNTSQIGKYFGADEKNEIFIEDNSNNDMDVYHDYLIHNGGQVDNRVAKIKFKPKTTHWSGIFSYLYNFHSFIKDLSFQIRIPFEYVENNLRYSFASQGYLADEDANVVLEYLKGNYELLTSEASNQQEKLAYAKIRNKASKGGIANLDFALGYKVLNEKNKNAIIFLDFIVPTGNKPKGEYIFEPIYGNGKHFVLSLGAQGYFQLFKKEKKEFNLFWNAEYKYLFKNTQKRNLSVKSANWGQYYLCGKDGNENKPLIPAANILTQDAKVSPGSQIDGGINIAFNCSNFNFDFGYHFLFKEEEKVKLKNDFALNTYAIASPVFHTNEEFAVANATESFNSKWLNKTNIDTSVAQNPGILLHKISMDLGFDYKQASIKIFGAYFISSQNSTFDGWQIGLLANYYF